MKPAYINTLQVFDTWPLLIKPIVILKRKVAQKYLTLKIVIASMGRNIYISWFICNILIFLMVPRNLVGRSNFATMDYWYIAIYFGHSFSIRLYVSTALYPIYAKMLQLH